MIDYEKVAWLKKYYSDNNLPIDEFNIIGVRDSKDLEKDEINDYLGYWTPGDIFICPGTTEPGVYWTKDKKERNVSGTFHLKPGFHKAIWCIGTHKGYEAFVNDYRYCQPTKGWRDANYDFVENAKDIEVCDYYGINFHRMHPVSLVNKIGKYSAGCQVVQAPDNFQKILSTAKRTGMYKNTPKKTVFNYLLLTIDQIPDGFLQNAPVV